MVLPETTLGEHVVQDYSSISLSLKAHPIAFFRDELAERGVITSAEHWDERLKGRYVRVAGLVLVRQQPGTAKGVIFITLEDETGHHQHRGVAEGLRQEPAHRDDCAIPRSAGHVSSAKASSSMSSPIELIDLTPRLRALGDGRSAAAEDREGAPRRLLEAQEPGFPLRGVPCL